MERSISQLSDRRCTPSKAAGLLLALVAGASTLLLPSNAHAQCNSNFVGCGITPIVNGQVYPPGAALIPGQIITYRVNLFIPPPVGEQVFCNVVGGQMSVTFPNGFTPPIPPPGQLVQIAGFGGATPDVPLFGDGFPFTIDTPTTYAVNAADESPNGFVTARVDYGSTAVRPGQINGTFQSTPPLQSASATASISTPFELPAIHLEKDAAPARVCPDVPTLITYTFTVTNPGETPLANVNVTDPDCDSGITGPSGDTNGNSQLDIGETWTYTCTRTVTIPAGGQPVVNTATASANGVADNGRIVESIFYTDEDSATVTVNAGPAVIVARDVIDLCAGESDTFIATISSGQAPYTVQWFDPSNQPIGNACLLKQPPFTCPLPVDSNFDPGLYCARVTDANGCLGEDCGTLEINPEKVVTVVRRLTSVCEGTDNVTFTATVTGGRPNYTVVWRKQGNANPLITCNDVASGGTCVLTLNNVAEADEGTYCAEATDTNGCVGSDCGELVVNPNRVVDVTPDNQEVCVGEDATFSASASGGTAPYTIQWRKQGNATVLAECVTGEGQGCALVLNDVELGDAGTFCASVVDANGCTDEACATLVVNSPPPCDIDGPLDVCPGVTREYCAPAGLASYDWNVSGPCSISGLDNEQCVDVTFNGPGTCVVSVVLTNADGCESECDVDVDIQDIADCIINGAGQVCTGTSSEYCAASVYATYDWNVAGPCSISGADNTQCITVNFTGTGNCNISLAAVDQAGCEAACTKNVSVIDCAVCKFIIPPASEPDCGSVNNSLTADVNNTTPTTTYSWSVVSGPCVIQTGADSLNITYSIGTDCSVEVCCLFRLTVDDPGDNAPPSVCELEVCCEPCQGGEGRTPGFWKQAHHFGHWPDQWCPHASCGCTPTQFCAVFNCAGAGAGCASAVNAAYANKTLLQVLQQGGGGFKALGRHAVAGLLNSGVDPNILDYAFSTAEVIAMVNNAIATCQTQPAHSDLADNNELEGGSLGGQSFCTDLNLDGAVNNNDLSIILSNWGRPGAGDIDANGIVGARDLSILLSNWGTY